MGLKPTGYSLPQIVLHWTIAALVILQLLFGESMVTVVDAAEEGTTVAPLDQNLAWLHYWSGIAILVLVAVRLALRLTRGVPEPLNASDVTGKLAGLTHALFYVLLVAVPITGLLGYYLGDPWGEIHQYAKPVFIILIALHLAAVLFHQFWLRDTTLRRMLSPE